MLSELFDEEYQRAQYDKAAKNAEREAALAEGEAKGRAEGMAKLKQALANLIASGMEESQAKKILGL